MSSIDEWVKFRISLASGKLSGLCKTVMIGLSNGRH